MPRVLFVNPNFDDFLGDGLFHGLRLVLGADVVDFPRVDHMYEDFPLERRPGLHGRGFTLAGLLEDLPVDRHRSLARALDREFDLVVFSDIWRTFGVWTEWGPPLADRSVRIAVIDGSDRVEPFPYAGQWWRRRSWWTLPRIQGRAMHFKREVTPATWWFGSYLMLPPRLARRAGRLGELRPIAFSIPESAIVTTPPAKTKDWPVHVVDAEVAYRVGGETDHAFDSSDDYQADLRMSRFGITTKREGWDALRHYEIAANGALPCFRRLEDKPPRCPPYGLADGTNAISYRDADDLLARVAALSDADYERLQAGALAWARANTTLVRAREFLRATGL
jgi:hypothetical protein